MKLITPGQHKGEDVSALVLAIRRQLSLSQGALAKRLGVTTATVSNWENGHNGAGAGNVALLRAMLPAPPTARRKRS